MRVKSIGIRVSDGRSNMNVWLPDNASDEFIIESAIERILSNTKFQNKEKAMAWGGMKSGVYIGEQEGTNTPEVFVLQQNGTGYFTGGTIRKFYLNG